jgi:hypothetical protein
MLAAYVDFNGMDSQGRTMTVVDWPNDEPPFLGQRVIAYTEDDVRPFGCLATVFDFRLVAKGAESTEWLLYLRKSPTLPMSVSELLQVEREERDMHLASLTHRKVSSFGDDTCSCGYDGWPCQR